MRILSFGLKVFALLLLTNLASHAAWAFGQTNKQDLIAEYTKAVPRLIEQGRQLEMTGTYDSMAALGSPDETIRKFSYRALRQGDRLLLDSHWLPDKIKEHSWEQTVVAVNDRHFFDVRKKTAADPFVLKEVGNVSTAAPQLEEALQLMESAFRMSLVTVAEILAEKDYVLDSITDQEENGEHIVKVEYHRRANALSNPVLNEIQAKRYPVKGWFVLNPSHKYRLEKYMTINGFKHEDTVRIVYRNDDDLAVVEWASELKQDSYVGKFEYHVDSVKRQPIPASEFTLKAFGLGEIEEPPLDGKSRMTSFVFFSLSAVLLGLALFMRRRFRQAG